MGSVKGKYCQRCRARSTTTYTYCRFCGEVRYNTNPLCDVHDGNRSGSLALSDSESDSPPAYSDDDANETDASSSSDYANDVDVRSSSDDASDVDVSSSSDDANDVDVSSSSDDANDVDVSSSRASAHEDAQQCEICKKWFDSYWQYDDHVEENNSGCWQHKECFPQSDNFRHARESHHQKCFVGGCKSLYAEDSDNDDKDIMDHIWDEHTIRG